VAIWQAVVLGITQGLTEFLPVSSSGHLVIVQSLMAVPEGIAISFDIVVHLGTLLAVLLYFRQDLCQLLQGIFKRDPAALRLFGALALGTVPAVIIGFLLKDFFEQVFAQPVWIGAALLINGVMLLAVNRFAGKGDLTGVRLPDAFWIGLGQAVAIFPGISRSGSTIAVGLLQRHVKRRLSGDWGARFLDWLRQRRALRLFYHPPISWFFTAWFAVSVRYLLPGIRGRRSHLVHKIRFVLVLGRVHRNRYDFE
jgi:undecaprenyl-diphosphatase